MSTPSQPPSQPRVPPGTPQAGQFVATDRPESDVTLSADTPPTGTTQPTAPAEPTHDQSYCDVGRHQQCSGYTEDEGDPETCMCSCHGDGLSR